MVAIHKEAAPEEALVEAQLQAVEEDPQGEELTPIQDGAMAVSPNFKRLISFYLMRRTSQVM